MVNNGEKTNPMVGGTITAVNPSPPNICEKLCHSLIEATIFRIPKHAKVSKIDFRVFLKFWGF
jgi:hypothetical protein